jgi:hypothetical protein
LKFVEVRGVFRWSAAAWTFAALERSIPVVELWFVLVVGERRQASDQKKKPRKMQGQEAMFDPHFFILKYVV